uniref:Uncharacterized protein n=1 Tax=Mucochytrium quahogii TaxID=96639 RepID=A0A7S2W6R5_9STRA|mmetsp:Transcript_13218/g.23690  ORF Transcript_13218/g.23690 Transcript_13218/m.23690 type:complete len:904 (-) Transcript_13218:614-3325(-)
MQMKMRIGVWLLVSCIVAAHCGFTTKLKPSPACGKDNVCLGLFETKGVLKHLENEIDPALDLPKRVDRDISRYGSIMTKITSLVADGTEVVKFILLFVGGEFEYIIKGLTTIISDINRVLKKSAEAAKSVHNKYLGKLVRIAPKLKQVLFVTTNATRTAWKVLDAYHSVVTVSREMCLDKVMEHELGPIYNLAHDAFNVLEKPIQAIDSTMHGVIDVTEKVTEVVASDVMKAFANTVGSVAGAIESFFNIFGPIIESVTKLVNAFEDTWIGVSFRVLWWWVHIGITVRVFLHTVVSSVDWLVDNILKWLSWVPGFGQVAKLIRGIVTNLCGWIEDRVKDIFHIGDLIIGDLSNEILQPLQKALDRFETGFDELEKFASSATLAIKRGFREAKMEVTLKLEEDFGISGPCWHPETQATECLQQVFPGLTEQILDDAKLPMDIGKVADMTGNLWKTLAKAITGCKKFQWVPISDFLAKDFVSKSAQCKSKAKLPICEEIQYADKSTEEGGKLATLLDQIGEQGHKKQSNLESGPNFGAWSVVLYPNVLNSQILFALYRYRLPTETRTYTREQIFESTTWGRLLGGMTRLDFARLKFRVFIEFQGAKCVGIYFRPRITLVEFRRTWTPELSVFPGRIFWRGAFASTPTPPERIPVTDGSASPSFTSLVSSHEFYSVVSDPSFSENPTPSQYPWTDYFTEFASNFAGDCCRRSGLENVIGRVRGAMVELLSGEQGTTVSINSDNPPPFWRDVEYRTTVVEEPTSLTSEPDHTLGNPASWWATRGKGAAVEISWFIPIHGIGSFYKWNQKWLNKTHSGFTMLIETSHFSFGLLYRMNTNTGKGDDYLTASLTYQNTPMFHDWWNLIRGDRTTVSLRDFLKKFIPKSDMNGKVGLSASTFVEWSTKLKT